LRNSEFNPLSVLAKSENGVEETYQKILNDVDSDTQNPLFAIIEGEIAQVIKKIQNHFKI